MTVGSKKVLVTNIRKRWNIKDVVCKSGVSVPTWQRIKAGLDVYPKKQQEKCCKRWART